MIDFDYDPPGGPLVYLHQDEAVLVMDKPSGLLSVPGKLDGRKDCLQSRLFRAHPESLLVHRLDCDTSGVIIFARSKAAQGFLGQEFEQRRAQKTYVARVAGVIAEDAGHIDLPLAADWPNRPRQQVDPQGRAAQTDWQVLERSRSETRVRLTPHTGRSHQLRVHMLALGHPILGDPIYSPTAADHPRLMLHATGLVLAHPLNGRMLTLASPAPF